MSITWPNPGPAAAQKAIFDSHQESVKISVHTYAAQIQ